jgi:hypothetical protein
MREDYAARRRALPAMEYEERLDGYRQEVERRLGDQLRTAAVHEFERFFDHVVTCFDRGTDEGECAEAWLTRAAD